MSSDYSVVYAIAGAPASGKTSFAVSARNNGLLPADAFVHDCDAVMESMPGYQQQLLNEGSIAAFNSWELPARELAEQQLKQQVAAKNSIIYDRSCALTSSYEFLKDLVQNKHYKLIMHLLYIDVNEACIRAKQRETIIGRYTSEIMVSERLTMLSSLWPEYLKIATEATILDNTDVTPRLVATYKQKNLHVHDPEMYSKFINIGTGSNS